MSELFEEIAARYERRAIDAGRRYLAADDVLQVLTPGHEHYATAKTQHDTARQLMFDAFSDLAFVKQSTGA
jgi:hypothetical protein